VRRSSWTRDRVTFTTRAGLRCSVVLASTLLTLGCGEFYVSPPDDCSTEKQAEFLYDVFEKVYLWNDEIPARESLNFASYEDPKDILKDLKYKKIDRWSYVADKVESDALFKEGKFIGYGGCGAATSWSPSIIISSRRSTRTSSGARSGGRRSRA